MTNHVHLLVTPDHALGPAYMMQAIGRRYVRYFNDRYARTGALNRQAHGGDRRSKAFSSSPISTTLTP